MRKLATAAAVSLALASGGAFGLGLGDIEMRSALNQPMNAEIRLTSVKAGELDGMIVQLASADAFARAGIERSTALTDLRFTVDTSTGVPLIRISSQRPVVEPFLNFLLEVDWPQGRMVREYTVLLDPPVFMTPSATQRNTSSDRPAVVQRGEEALVVPTPIERASTLDEEDFDVELVELIEESGDGALSGDQGDAQLQVGELVPLDDGDIVSLDALDDSELLSDGDPVLLTDGDIVSLTDLGAPNTAASAQREAESPQLFDIGSIEVELVGDGEEISDDTIVGGPADVADVADVAAEPVDDSTIVSLDDLDLAEDSLAGTAANTATNAADEVTVGNGDTLYEIADTNSPTGISVQQMMMALLAANDAAFINSNINLVKAGSIMRVPGADEASRLTQSQALAAVDEQNQLWQEYRDSLRNGSATQIAQGSDSGSAADAPTGGESDAIESASIDADETLDGLSAEARAILENARNEILNRDELRIVADNAPTSNAASATSDDTTENDSQRLSEVNRKLQLAREELSSSRLQADDLTDQAGELQNTSENLDSLVSMRQNEIAQLEAQLQTAREAELETAEAEADAQAAAVSDAVAKAAADADAVAKAEAEAAAEAENASVEAADDLIADASNAIANAGSDAAAEAGNLADSAAEAASEGANAAVAGLTGAANDAADAGTNALTEAGETLKQVELVGDENAATEESEALIAPPVKQTTWYQDFLSDPKRMMIAGIGGVGLLGVLGTLLFRRRRKDDDDDSMLDIGDSEEFAENDEDDTFASTVDLAAAGTAGAGGAVAGAAAIHDAMDNAVDVTDLDETLSDKFDDMADASLDFGSETQAVAAAVSDEGLDQDDTISEVDVYLAYGLHGQAEELLTKAIERKPEQQQYAQKLLQTYHAQGNADGFHAAATDFHARFGGDSNPEWANIASMGEELKPGDALFAAGLGAAATMAAGHDEAVAMGDDDFLSSSEGDDMGSISRDFTSGGDAVDMESEEESLMDKSLDPAFAFDESDLEATGDFSQIADELAAEDNTSIDFPGFEDSASVDLDNSISAGADATLDPAAELLGDALSMDELDLAAGSADDLTLDLDQLSGDLELDASELLNADLSDLDMPDMDMPDLTVESELLAGDALADDGADEMETMLDLAKAYIDMGDKDSASSALGEIVKSGSPEQVSEAETLLKNIS